MDWFSRHTNWLYRETKELSNSSIYNESFQFIGKTLISTGNILVHKETTEYFPILIVYPKATPYLPPTIYILNEKIVEDDVEFEIKYLSAPEYGINITALDYKTAEKALSLVQEEVVKNLGKDSSFELVRE